MNINEELRIEQDSFIINQEEFKFNDRRKKLSIKHIKTFSLPNKSSAMSVQTAIKSITTCT